MIPLDGARRVDVQGTHTGVTSYHKGRDGAINVHERHVKSLIREGLAVPASATGPVAHLRGFQCPCGRRNYFKTCGACGSAEGVRE